MVAHARAALSVFLRVMNAAARHGGSFGSRRYFGLPYPACEPEGKEGGAGAPAGDGKTTPPAPPAPPPKDWEAEFKASEKRASKFEKDHNALAEKYAATDAVLQKLKGALIPGDDKADPVAKFNELQQQKTAAEQERDRARLANSIFRAAAMAGAEDPDDHLDEAVRAGVKFDDVDGIKEYVEKRKAAKPYMFKAPAADPPKGAPGTPTSSPPKIGAPEHKAPVGSKMPLVEFQKLSPQKQAEQRAKERSMSN